MEPSQTIMPAINNELKSFGNKKANNYLKEVATEITKIKSDISKMY